MLNRYFGAPESRGEMAAVEPHRVLYNRSLMAEEHLTCLKCGYDLYGIPQVRCPECGFGFDYAALRAIAESTEWARLAAARFVLVRATIAAGLTVLPVISILGLGTFGRIVMVLIAYAGALVVWIYLTDVYRGPESLPTVLGLSLVLAVFIVTFVVVLPWIAYGVAVLLVLWAWRARLFYWPTLYRPDHAKPTDLSKSTNRHSAAATWVLALASILVLVIVLVVRISIL